MINFYKTVVFLIVIVYISDYNVVNAIQFKDDCYHETNYNYTDTEPRICINYLTFHGNHSDNGTYYNHTYDYFSGDMSIVTCVYKPQSHVKLSYYEKRGPSPTQVFESIDKGQVMSHIKLVSARSPSHVVCTTNDELNKTYVMNITLIPTSGNITHFELNKMQLPLMLREINGTSQANTSEYFVNPGERVTAKLENGFNGSSWSIKNCEISTSYKVNTTGSTKERYGVFVFNSSNAETIECKMDKEGKFILNMKPYAAMPSSLTSDHIFIRGLYWYNMLNMYVRQDSDKYNFTYTYNYTKTGLNLTCVSQTKAKWIYDDKAIKVNGEVKYYNKTVPYLGYISFKLNKGYDDASITCVSEIGHNATVLLQRTRAAGKDGTVITIIVISIEALALGIYCCVIIYVVRFKRTPSNVGFIIFVTVMTLEALALTFTLIFLLWQAVKKPSGTI